MDKAYADTVRLLLDSAPHVFANEIFAMKGGTAINLFLRDMPRLSVDIDVVYVPRHILRDEALEAIQQELAAIRQRLAERGIEARLVGNQAAPESKLLIENETSQVKVEVNTVFRGTVLPIKRQSLCERASDLFSTEFDSPLLSPDELYGGKLVAAFDRQHPRDLFDAWHLFETDGLTDGMVECFVTYLAGHNRPIHEVLFGNDKDIARDYENSFVGMADVPCSLDTLLECRQRLRTELPGRLSTAQRQFLVGLARATPDWSLLACPYAEELPALRWKLSNLETFRRRRPKDWAQQAQQLETAFARY